MVLTDVSLFLLCEKVERANCLFLFARSIEARGASTELGALCLKWSWMLYSTGVELSASTFGVELNALFHGGRAECFYNNWHTLSSGYHFHFNMEGFSAHPRASKEKHGDLMISSFVYDQFIFYMTVHYVHVPKMSCLYTKSQNV